MRLKGAEVVSYWALTLERRNAPQSILIMRIAMLDLKASTGRHISACRLYFQKECIVAQENVKRS